MMGTIDYADLFATIENRPSPDSLHDWLPDLKQQLLSYSAIERWGDAPKWHQALDRLAELITNLDSPISYQLDSSHICIDASSVDANWRLAFKAALKALHPWRKGPFDVFGVHIDTEWRSDWKWQRLVSAIDTLEDETILDIGSGNGYYGWRMLGLGAKLVIGIDPTYKFVLQWQAIRQCLPEALSHFVLPMGIEQLPASLSGFDRVFSMGVLYHRKSPLEHLLRIKQLLRPGGHLVLETLVIDGPEGMSLVPDHRYAKMRNVWFIPSTPTLLQWLQRVGFTSMEVIDESITTVEEQRQTPWMQFESLADFLDPTDPTRTIEGHPAPKRAMVIATKAK